MQSLGSPLQDSRSLIRLWAHEAMRVFHDRLVDDADRGWFCALLSQMVPKHMASAFDGVFNVSNSVPPSPAAALKAPPESIEEAAKQREQAEASAALRDVLFADFLQPGSAEMAKYQEATDVSKLLKRVEDSLMDYNEQVRTNVSHAYGAISARACPAASSLRMRPACQGAPVTSCE